MSNNYKDKPWRKTSYDSNARVWTATVKWTIRCPDGKFDEHEEIDVEAPSRAQARVLVLKALEEDYEPGGQIVKIEPAELAQIHAY